MKLTKAQIAVLERIEQLTSNGGCAHKAQLMGANGGILERLETMGAIKSQTPFAFTYHSVTLTDAGRAALRDAKGDGL